jgi:hypothetical protein
VNTCAVAYLPLMLVDLVSSVTPSSLSARAALASCLSRAACGPVLVSASA